VGWSVPGGLGGKKGLLFWRGMTNWGRVLESSIRREIGRYFVRMIFSNEFTKDAIGRQGHGPFSAKWNKNQA